MSPIVQIWAHHDTICSPDMKVLFMRGDLLIEDSVIPAQTTNFFFRMLCGNARSLTLSHALSAHNVADFGHSSRYNPNAKWSYISGKAMWVHYVKVVEYYELACRHNPMRYCQWLHFGPIRCCR